MALITFGKRTSFRNTFEKCFAPQNLIHLPGKALIAQLLLTSSFLPILLFSVIP